MERRCGRVQLVCLVDGGDGGRQGPEAAGFGIIKICLAQSWGEGNLLFIFWTEADAAKLALKADTVCIVRGGG